MGTLSASADTFNCIVPFVGFDDLMVGIYRNPKVTIRLKASAGNIEQYGSGIAGWNRPGTGRQDGCAELDCGD